ncbi:unnamed protein product [marine sediment metagenome]|uniref:Uncharacterized protein n=1 Tax=marine sediment metagenome TaxID=412755 RepID=X1W0S9_9ZZZZ
MIEKAILANKYRLIIKTNKKKKYEFKIESKKEPARLTKNNRGTKCLKETGI